MTSTPVKNVTKPDDAYEEKNIQPVEEHPPQNGLPKVPDETHKPNPYLEEKNGDRMAADRLSPSNTEEPDVVTHHKSRSIWVKYRPFFHLAIFLLFTGQVSWSEAQVLCADEIL
jgi:hypothetical protein